MTRYLKISPMQLLFQHNWFWTSKKYLSSIYISKWFLKRHVLYPTPAAQWQSSHSCVSAQYITDSPNNQRRWIVWFWKWNMYMISVHTVRQNNFFIHFQNYRMLIKQDIIFYIFHRCFVFCHLHSQPRNNKLDIDGKLQLDIHHEY